MGGDTPSSPPQAVFVPVQTCATLLVNMATGLLVWEDAQVGLVVVAVAVE